MEKELHREVWLSRLFAWLELSDDVQLDLYESSFGRWSQSCVFFQTFNVFLHGECLFTFPLESSWQKPTSGLSNSCLIAKHRLNFNQRPDALPWTFGSEVSRLL